LQLAHRLFCDWQNLGEEGHDHVSELARIHGFNFFLSDAACSGFF
jgi:hypothetical protein